MILKVEDILPGKGTTIINNELSRPLETDFSQTGHGSWVTKERTRIGVSFVLEDNGFSETSQ